jgi:predicted HicB family RNase H-like nuclease
MMNKMVINGYSAVIGYDPEVEMLRGEFTGLNGGVDFYARDIENLRREGEISLQVFLDACHARGIEPKKTFSGKFNIRLPENLHAAIAEAASAEGKSLNQWITEILRRKVGV